MSLIRSGERLNHSGGYIRLNFHQLENTLSVRNGVHTSVSLKKKKKKVAETSDDVAVVG